MQAPLRLVLTALLLLPLVSAAAQVQGPELVDACLGSEATSTLLITNTGVAAQTYGLFTSSSLQTAVIFMPNTLTLQPGAQGAATVRYRFTERGTQEVPVAIVSTTGERTDVTQAVRVGVCNNNYVLALDINQTSCPCLPLTYHFLVRNTGSEVESYSFSMDRYAEYGVLSHNPLVLSPGQEQEVTLTLQLPCDIHGEQIIMFTSRAQTSRIKASVPLLANVQACYDYALEAGTAVPLDEGRFEAPISAVTSVEVCAGDAASVPLRVRSGQYFSNNYTLTLQGPDWASLYTDELMTPASGRARTALDLQIPQDAFGTQTMLLTATSTAGGAEELLSLDVEVAQCHGLLVELPEQETACACTTQRIPLTVTNTGRFGADLSLTHDGPEWVFLPASLTLQSGEISPLGLTISPPCDLRGRQHVTVSADSGQATSGDGIQLDIVPLDACYQPEIESSSRTRIDYEETRIPLTIRNDGVKPATYVLTLRAPEWVSIDATNLTIVPGTRKTVVLTARPGNVSIGDYDVRLTMQAGEVAYETAVTLALRERGNAWDRLRQNLYVYRAWVITGIILLGVLIALGMRIRRRLQIRQIRRLIREGRNGAAKNNKNAKKSNAAKNGRKETSSMPWDWRHWLWPLILLALVVALVVILSLDLPFASSFSAFLNTYFLYIVAGLVLLVAIIALQPDR